MTAKPQARDVLPGAAASHDERESRFSGWDCSHILAGAQAAAAILAIAGLWVAGAWAFSDDAQQRLSNGDPGIMPGTALGFLLAGCFIWRVRNERIDAPLGWIGRVCAGLLAGAPALLIILYIQRWWHGSALSEFSLVLGAPSFLTAVNFMLFGAAMLLLSARSSRVRTLGEMFLVAGMLIALLALIGYACGVASFYTWRSLFGGRAMALETAVLMIVLGLGLLCARPEQELTRILLSQTRSGTVARRLVLAPVLIPLVTGLLQNGGLKLGIYNPELAGWLFSFLNLFIFTAAICWSARLLYRAELIQKQAEHALQAANAELEERVELRTSELAAAEAKFRVLVEQSIAGIYAIQDDQFAYVNPKMAEIAGFSAAELTSQPLRQFIHEEDWPRVSENIRRRLQGELRHAQYSLRMVRKDGSVIQVEVYGTRSEYNGRPAILGTLLDVTQRRAAEEEVRALNATLERRVQERTRELAQANKELESFSYSVSHDLRAPLRHMGGFVELLQKRAGDRLDEKCQRYVKVIAESVGEMAALIDDLLSFSRMGRAEMRATEVDCAQLVHTVVEELSLETSGREIEWQIAPLPVVAADPALLRQVFVNLISNALKYSRTRARARIEIGCAPSIESAPEEHVFFVRDNGVGFDMKYADKLFGVFQRLHTVQEFEGTGIGLANVQRIISRHGGRTWAEGTVDQGATFYFSLPGTAPEPACN